MGSVSFRTYHEVRGDDRSRLGEQVAAQRRRVSDRMRSIVHVIAVVSGKGGVGKSYVTAALALASSRQSKGVVGVLDADLASPTIARLLEANSPLRVDDEGVHPAVGREGVKLCSMDLLLDEGQPLTWKEPRGERFVWRGVLETGALREFLADVAWGTLDLLFVDMPPGTDRLGDLAELVPNLSGALVVTIPSEESRRSVERAMRGAKGAGIPILGVVENMSGYACSACGTTGPLFDGDAGTALATEFGVPLIGRVPFRLGPHVPALPHSILDRLLDRLAESRIPNP
jgi:ATP-binding protein involved in chromosome partitioning